MPFVMPLLPVIMNSPQTCFEDYLTVLYDRYEVASFRRWLAKLPRKVFMQRALLRLLQCRFKIESVQLSEAKTILEDIEDHRKEAFGRYEEGKKRLCEDYLLLFKCILPYWLDPVSVNVEELKQYDSGLPGK